MKHSFIKLMSFIIFSQLVAVACSNDDPMDSFRGQNTETIPFTESRVKLTEIIASPSGAPTITNKITAPADCTYVADNYVSEGSTCITPINVMGYAEQAHIVKNNGSVMGGTRLLG